MQEYVSVCVSCLLSFLLFYFILVCLLYVFASISFKEKGKE